MQTNLCIKSGIYVKVLIFGSYFLLMFPITVSKQEFFNSRERNGGKWSAGGEKKHELGNFFMVLQRQTLIITTPFVHSLMFRYYFALSRTFITVKHCHGYFIYC